MWRWLPGPWGEQGANEIVPGDGSLLGPLLPPPWNRLVAGVSQGGGARRRDLRLQHRRSHLAGLPLVPQGVPADRPRLAHLEHHAPRARLFEPPPDGVARAPRSAARLRGAEPPD